MREVVKGLGGGRRDVGGGEEGKKKDIGWLAHLLVLTLSFWSLKNREKHPFYLSY